MNRTDALDRLEALTDAILRPVSETQDKLRRFTERMRADLKANEPHTSAWRRLCRLLENARDDPTVSASNVCTDFVELVLEIASDAFFAPNVDAAFRERDQLLERDKQIKRARRKRNDTDGIVLRLAAADATRGRPSWGRLSRLQTAYSLETGKKISKPRLSKILKKKTFT